jgi:hypothetical protein
MVVLILVSKSKTKVEMTMLGTNSSKKSNKELPLGRSASAIKTKNITPYFENSWEIFPRHP